MRRPLVQRAAVGGLRRDPGALVQPQGVPPRAGPGLVQMARLHQGNGRQDLLRGQRKRLHRHGAGQPVVARPGPPPALHLRVQRDPGRPVRGRAVHLVAVLVRRPPGERPQPALGGEARQAREP
ncbi:hypothetical protein VTK73DRAFT_5827 [Phialemonium thermophilum]|uniref:Uncharacterized protein n=1 Tax=Phialemonium thermophilum TaxID=223376 RepID=A0ABR3V1F1_9PEZI